MRACLSLEGVGLIPGRFFGWNGGCSGEIVHYKAPYFAPQILTDPSYLGKIAVVDVENIDGRWPMPEESQSFMPHLAGLVFLGHVTDQAGAGEHFTLRNYLNMNRIPAFFPDDPGSMLQAAKSTRGLFCAIDRDADRAESRLKFGAKPLDFHSIASPQEYIWDLASGDMPEENINLLIWDHGANNGLLRSLKKIGARLRVVPPNTEPEHIIALHPDGVVIAGGPYPAELGNTLSRIERIIGIRPVLAVGSGALLVARSMGIPIEPLESPHYSAAMIVNDLSGAEIETYQAHAFAPSRAGLEQAGCEITHVSADDGTVEGFVCPDYDITAMMFTMTSEPVAGVLREYVAGIKNEVVL
jgi:carbamoyl-phosphate synthase small subunit